MIFYNKLILALLLGVFLNSCGNGNNNSNNTDNNESDSNSSNTKYIDHDWLFGEWESFTTEGFPPEIIDYIQFNFIFLDEYYVQVNTLTKYNQSYIQKRLRNNPYQGSNDMNIEKRVLKYEVDNDNYIITYYDETGANPIPFDDTRSRLNVGRPDSPRYLKKTRNIERLSNGTYQLVDENTSQDKDSYIEKKVETNELFNFKIDGSMENKNGFDFKNNNINEGNYKKLLVGKWARKHFTNEAGYDTRKGSIIHTEDIIVFEPNETFWVVDRDIYGTYKYYEWNNGIKGADCTIISKGDHFSFSTNKHFSFYFFTETFLKGSLIGYKKISGVASRDNIDDIRIPHIEPEDYDYEENEGVEIEAPSYDNQIYDKAEVAPQFQGGEQEMMKFIAQNIKYPTIAVEQGIQGRVETRFLVNRDGTISDITITKSLNHYLDREAIRVVKSMPKWIAGQQNGQNVDEYYTLPIYFRLN